MRKLLKVSVIGALCIVLAGCASNPTKNDKVNTIPPKNSTPNSSSQIENTDKVPGSIPGYEGARADVELISCEPKNGLWTAQGKLTNSAVSKKSYRIFVAFNEDNDTHNVKSIDVNNIDKSEEKSWKVASDLDTKYKITECILRVERFDK